METRPFFQTRVFRSTKLSNLDIPAPGYRFSFFLKILSSKGDTDEAVKTLRVAISLEPENKAVLLVRISYNLNPSVPPPYRQFNLRFPIQELNKLNAKRKEEKQNEKMLYKRMFNTSATNGKTSSGDSTTGFQRSLNLALVAGGVIVAIAGVMAYRYVS